MTDWLIDKSALVRLGESADARVWAERVERGLVRITTVTRLEVGFSGAVGQGRPTRVCRSPVGRDAGRVPHSLGRGPRPWRFKLLLADHGQHRAPCIPDLMIAAAAELAGLIVLHVDKDFELIADVTGQAIERLGRAPGAI